MSKSNPSWNHYKAFFEVLRLGSLSAAARHLGLRQSTVGRQIESLEGDLGVSLFTRSQLGLKPTDAALRLRPHLDALNIASEALARDAQLEDSGDAGTIRITTSETIGIEILPKVMYELGKKFPLIKFELSITNDFENLLEREADIAIRTNNFEQKAILSKKIGELEMGLFASKRYLRGKMVPRKVEDLKDHPIIGFDEETDRMRQVRKRIASFERADFAFLTDNVTLHSKLVDADCGIGLAYVEAGRPDRVRILPEYYSLRFGVWLAMHENLKANRKHRSVFKALGDSLKIILAKNALEK